MKKSRRGVEDSIRALERAIQKFGDWDGKRHKALEKLRKELDPRIPNRGKK
jgi:hypothetical protein